MQHKYRHHARLRFLYALLLLSLAAAAVGSVALYALRNRFRAFPTSSF